MKMYTKKVKSAAAFSNMRGVTDFSNAAQFNLYEKGYSHLFVINGPAYIEKLITETNDNDLRNLYYTFLYIIEFEFKGLDGIEDITVENIDVTDNISTLSVIGKVNKQSASEISMNYTEKSGSTITNFIRYYLEGIKDPRTQAKTYHGLIKRGIMAGGFENEVFNLMYIVTDNTMLQVEKAYLLCNAWPNKAQTSIYESEKGSIEKADITVTWQCFVIDGAEIDKHAVKILSAANEKIESDGKFSNAQGGTAVEGAYKGTGNDLDESSSLFNKSASINYAANRTGADKNLSSEDAIIHLNSTGDDDATFVYDVAVEESGKPLNDYLSVTSE